MQQQIWRLYVVWQRVWILIVMVRYLSIILVTLLSEYPYHQLILQAVQTGMLVNLSWSQMPMSTLPAFCDHSHFYRGLGSGASDRSSLYATCRCFGNH